MRKILLINIFLFCWLSSYCQTTYLMPTSGSNQDTTSYAIVYDDGGANGNYTAHANGTYTFYTPNPNTRFQIKVKANYGYTSGNADLRIFDGPSTTTDLNNYQYIYNSDTLMYYSQGNVVTIQFISDVNNPSQGFEITLQEAGCTPAYNVESHFIDTNTLMIQWNEEDTTTHWVIDCIYPNIDRGEEEVFGLNEIDFTRYSDTNFILINNLDPHHIIYFNIYPDCSSYPGNGIGYLSQACPCVLPQNIQTTNNADSVYISWHNPYNYPITWTVNCSPLNDIEYITDTVYSRAIGCNEGVTDIQIVGNCDPWLDHYGATTAYCNMDAVHVADMLCPDINFYPQDVSDSSIVIVWQNTPRASGYIIGCKEYFLGDEHTIYDTIQALPYVYPYIQFDTILGLKENTYYKVTLTTICQNGSLSCGNSNTRYIYTSLNNCIDYTNIYSDKTSLYWGTYENPYAEDEENNNHNYHLSDYYNYGFYDNDAHTPINDSTMRDYRTGYALRCVPQGEKASMRLGNTFLGDAEAISYDYYVDTSDKDMLILKYAVVLQDPNHTRVNQPRFTLEILDSNNNLIDSTCCFADFYASGDLGWNQVPNTDIIWKDWTTVGIDIAPYNGQNIKVRLTTYDCAEGGHYGYAYFTIGCDNKRIYLLNKCDGLDSIWLQAPLGFEYQWTKANNPNTIISTDYQVKVPVDSIPYICLASFVGKPECNFTIASVPVDIKPVAKVHYDIDICNAIGTFYSDSYLSMDSSYGSYTKQFIDEIYWVVDDNDTVVADSLVYHFTQNRHYKIVCYSRLSDSQCIDSAVLNLQTTFVNTLSITAPDTVCYGDIVSLQTSGNVMPIMQYLWSDNSTNNQMTTPPIYEDTSFWVVVKYYDNCFDTATVSITPLPIYRDTINAIICQGQTYDSLGFSANSTGQYFFYIPTDMGCDSTFVLNLQVLPIYDDTIQITTCDSAYIDDNFALENTGFYTANLVSEYGCDSIVTIDFTRINAQIEALDTICYGDSITLTLQGPMIDSATYLWNNNSTSRTIQSGPLYENTSYSCSVNYNNNCSLNAHIDINVMPQYYDTIRAHICQGQVYDSLGFEASNTGLFAHRLTSVYGCDSTTILLLTVHRGYEDTLTKIGCDTGFYDDNFAIEESGLYTMNLSSIYGCDSIVTIDFHRYETFTDSVKGEIYVGDTFTDYGFEAYNQGIFSVVYQDEHGCDSTYILDLNVIDLKFPNVVTPNGDGINDIYDIHDLLNQQFFTYTSLRIYSRYGKMIYFKENIHDKEDCWDPNDTNSPEGTYFYRFTARSRTKNIDATGTIEVLRDK